MNREGSWWWLVDRWFDLDPLLWTFGIVMAVAGVVSDSFVHVAIGAFLCVLGTAPAADPRS